MRANEFVVEYKNAPLEEYGGLAFRIVTDDGQLIVHAFDPDWNTEIGHVIFNIGDSDELDPQDLFVKEKYRNQGVARTMYDFIKTHGYKIHRSWDQTDAGAGFWEKNRGEERVWEELTLPKNRWEVLLTASDKQEAGPELVNLVAHAYSNTDKGSMIQSLRDVVPSDWEVIDWDQDPDIDACIFYRKPRGNEQWVGYKLQGLGHDGARTSKNKAVEHILKLLNKPGVWIESSDALRQVLNKLHAPAVTGQDFLRRLFNDPTLKMVDDNTYVRTLPDGTKIKETVFGHPRLK